MLKCTLSAFILTACFQRMQANNKERRFESFCDANEPVEMDDSENGRGKFSHAIFNRPENWLINLNRNEEDGINIIVKSFNLKNSFLVIREASTAREGSSGKIQFISGESQENLNFFIPYAKSFYMEICPEENTNGKGIFTIEYERAVLDFGEGPLPTEPPEVEKERQAVEIQFKGKTPSEFSDELFIMKFKEAVKSIARDFCMKANISFESTKSANDMVTVHNIHKCPLEWSETEICTSVHHSVFVSGGDGVCRHIWEYQLTRLNLHTMWTSADNKYLQLIGLSIYRLPDKTLTIGWWLLIIVIPYLFVIGLVYLLRATYKYIVEDIQNNFSDTVEPTDAEKQRKSKLKPNKYQEVPSFLTERKMKDDERPQMEHKSYRAALLLASFKLKGSIPK